ncbi:alpha/beta fold hydrolase [Priestia taiwanensis]|uniref:Carboxylesterase n=1 Tax=Priestia taiwanensis TaxID=1347902 RepID=A0A917AU75_9BACI|nr:alpha/beta hydrolase [Priestia taiwanensis]MBM7363985.1 pimeloyl-ACP methyl ester carboxylesterase [Priestia taiwanensis]GGE70731.1 carboxylesterase [Priestia taiwanensis]
MNEKMTRINGVIICTESFGNPTNQAILLINGAMNSMVYWDAEFCQRLADTGRYVIRFDNRDVGRSMNYEPGTSNYTVVDMANDAVGVLDAYNINKAHVVGMSLGGMIAQVTAFHNPERVLSMTAIASSLFGSDDNNRGLPEMDERLFTYHAKGATLDWTNEEAVIDYLVEGARMLCGPSHLFDEKRVRELTTQDFNRATNLLSMFNHALLKGDDYYEDKIKEIAVPALVIHGTHDTILPYEHGIALADELLKASLLTLEGTGHEIHADDWDHIINAIFTHTSVSKLV